MRKIAVACLKGGSSKTTTATSLAIALATLKQRVLLIDTDASANATWLLTEGQGVVGPTAAEVLAQQATPAQAICPTGVKGLDLMPGSDDLGGVNLSLAQQFGRDTRMRTVMNGLADSYDYAIADTGPSMTTLLANVLLWANEIVVPLDAGLFALIGLTKLQEFVGQVIETYQHDALHFAGFLLTQVSNSNPSREIEQSLRAKYSGLVFKTTIPLAVKVEEATLRQQPFMTYAPKSPAAVAYFEFAREILNHGKQRKESGGVRNRKRPGKGTAA